MRLLGKKRQKDANTLLFIPIIFAIGISIIFFVFPTTSAHVLNECRHIINELFLPYYLFLGISFLLGTIYLAFGKWANVRIGGSEAKPIYSNMHWGMMIFTSTMSADILFYSLTEWTMYLKESPIRHSSQPYIKALSYSLFHWGPIAWSFYILLAVAFSYMIYVRKNKRQRFSEACRPILREKVVGNIGKIIDNLAIISLLTATATTFSMSLPLLERAIKNTNMVFDSKLETVLLLTCIVLIYMTISVLGLRTMSIFSVITFIFFIVFLIYVLIFGGEASKIIKISGETLYKFGTNSLSMTFDLKNRSFSENWTIYYWAYWIVWCIATPFFIGSISYGKTIREIVLGAYFWGIAGTFLSFLILGSYGISQVSEGKIAVEGNYASFGMKVLNTLPNSIIPKVLLVCAMIGLYSTVLDSIILVVSRYTQKEVEITDMPKRKLRFFWSIVFCILPMTLLITNKSFVNIQSFALIIALPISFIMVIIVIGLFKELIGSEKNSESN